jgi:hypothetical protein
MGILKQLVNLPRATITDIRGKVIIQRQTSEEFPLQHGLKQGDDLSMVISNLIVNNAIRKSENISGFTTFSKHLQYLAYTQNVVIRQIPRCQKASMHREAKCCLDVLVDNQHKTKYRVIHDLSTLPQEVIS